MINKVPALPFRLTLGIATALFLAPTGVAFLAHPHISVYDRGSLITSQRQRFSSRNIDSYASHMVQPHMSLVSGDDASVVAHGLGYLVGAGSLVLYTPIVVRLLRQRAAEGLTLPTWWLKLSAYTCSDVYAFTHGYPLSTYVETAVITVEATIILFLVAHYQERITAQFWSTAALFLASVGALLTVAPPELVALGQASSAVLNAGALAPQFRLNAKRRSAGDYSPVTAGLAGLGCLIRMYTTAQLAGGDPLLLGGFALGLCLNWALLSQILWYGVVVEGRSFVSILTADVAGPVTVEVDSRINESKHMIS